MILHASVAASPPAKDSHLADPSRLPGQKSKLLLMPELLPLWPRAKPRRTFKRGSSRQGNALRALMLSNIVAASTFSSPSSE